MGKKMMVVVVAFFLGGLVASIVVVAITSSPVAEEEFPPTATMEPTSEPTSEPFPEMHSPEWWEKMWQRDPEFTLSEAVRVWIAEGRLVKVHATSEYYSAKPGVYQALGYTYTPSGEMWIKFYTPQTHPMTGENYHFARMGDVYPESPIWFKEFEFFQTLPALDYEPEKLPTLWEVDE